MTEIMRDEKGHFLPGSTGNPGGLGGRPIGSVSLVKRLREHFYDNPNDIEMVNKTLINMAKTRELGAIRELFDRIDGKAIERHKIEGELPIKLIFMPASELLETHYNQNLGTPNVELIGEGTDAVQGQE